MYRTVGKEGEDSLAGAAVTRGTNGQGVLFSAHQVSAAAFRAGGTVSREKPKVFHQLESCSFHKGGHWSWSSFQCSPSFSCLPLREREDERVIKWKEVGVDRGCLLHRREGLLNRRCPQSLGLQELLVSRIIDSRLSPGRDSNLRPSDWKDAPLAFRLSRRRHPEAFC